MKNNNTIRVFIPIHKFDDTVSEMLPKALQSYSECKGYLVSFDNSYEIDFQIICPPEIEAECMKMVVDSGLNDGTVCVNKTGNYDFCSQVNYGVNGYDGQWFSVLEYDDTYGKKWFKQFNEYLLGREDVSIFLPINKLCNISNSEFWQYGNEAVWAGSFSNELGYIDHDCLESYTAFNLTGGIVKTDDFKKVGGLKPSVKVAFTYELFLRLTLKKYRIFVIPKEGYSHIYGVEGSLTETYAKEFTSEESSKWFELAKKECKYTEDRNKVIPNTKNKPELK